MTGLFRALGRASMGAMRYLGQLADLTMETGRSIVRGRIRWGQWGRQMVAIGFGSQTVVIVTGAFVGAVLTAQTLFKFIDYGVESTSGGVVAVAMCRELGPVFTGLMVAGRVGAAMAAEIGTMKVTEQIDALRALAVHPVDYLVVPRTLGILISMPLLVAEAIAFGIVSSWAISVIGFRVPAAWYRFHLYDNTELSDIAIGMIKGLVFGFIIVIISCHQGLTARNGAVGVGNSTTRAVVLASLFVLVANFFLTLVLNQIWPI